MTTRSMITVNTEQGINAIYCHWDGYLEHNGVILKKFYSTKESLKELFRNYDKKEQERTRLYIINQYAKRSRF